MDVSCFSKRLADESGNVVVGIPLTVYRTFFFSFSQSGHEEELSLSPVSSGGRDVKDLGGGGGRIF